MAFGIFSLGAGAAFCPDPKWLKSSLLLRLVLPLLVVYVYAICGGVLYYFLDIPSELSDDVYSYNASEDDSLSIAVCKQRTINASINYLNVAVTERRKISEWTGRPAPRLFQYHNNLTMPHCNDTIEPIEHLGLLDSIFVMWTVYTTIGYGVMAPSTWAGKIYMIVYATFGIPLSVFALLTCGDQLFQVVWVLYVKIVKLRRKKGAGDATKPRKDLHPADFPFLLSLSGFFLWLFIASLWFALIEKWSYFDSVYMVFCSLTKIGLGDISSTFPLSQITAMVFILMGMVLLSMCWALAIVKRNHLSDQIAERLMRDHQQRSNSMSALAANMAIENNLDAAVQRIEKHYLHEAGAVGKLVSKRQRKWLAQQMMRWARLRDKEVQTDPLKYQDKETQNRVMGVSVAVGPERVRKEQIIIRKPNQFRVENDLRYFPKAHLPFSLDFR